MASSSFETEFIYDVTYKDCNDDIKTVKCKKVPIDNYFKYVTSNNETFVLYSPGFGGGWSTWNYRFCSKEQLIFDTRIIDYITDIKTKIRLDSLSRYMIEDDVEIKKLMEIVFGNNDIYLGGFQQLTVALIPIGTMFRINEYDGSESIEIFNKKNYYTA